jgi:hypothetical protein
MSTRATALEILGINKIFRWKNKKATQNWPLKEKETTGFRPVSAGCLHGFYSVYFFSNF